jgi:hypothetical protein
MPRVRCGRMRISRTGLWALRNTNVPFDLATPIGSCLVGRSSLTGGRRPNLSSQPIDFREISAKLATTWHYVGAAAGACGWISRVGQASAAPSTWCATTTPCERDGIVQRSVGSIGTHSSSQPRSRRGSQNSDSMMTAAALGSTRASCATRARLAVIFEIDPVWSTGVGHKMMSVPVIGDHKSRALASLLGTGCTGARKAVRSPRTGNDLWHSRV